MVNRAMFRYRFRKIRRGVRVVADLGFTPTAQILSVEQQLFNIYIPLLKALSIGDNIYDASFTPTAKILSVEQEIFNIYIPLLKALSISSNIYEV